MRRQNKNKNKNSKLKLFNLLFLMITVISFIVVVGLMHSHHFLNFYHLNLLYTIIGISILVVSLSCIILNKLKVLTTVILFIQLFVVCITLLFFKSTIDVAKELNKNAKYSDIEMSVVVYKDSKIDNINKISNVLAPLENDKLNIESFLENIKSTKKITFSTENVVSYQKALETIKNDDTKAMILNSAYSSLIESIDGNFKKEIKTLYKYKIKKKSSLSHDSKKIDKYSFNIYISGIDTYGDISSVSRSDVNIIMTVNMKSHKILLTSTPRDSYVKIPDGGGNQYDKLTHAGIYGVETSMKTLSDLYKINIDYYTRVNFTSFLKLIDLLGGIEIYNDKEFIASENNYKFPIGTLSLDSEHALLFVRERYSLSGGDNDRGKNQEKVISAIINKIANVESLTKLPQIVDNFKDSVQTNISIDNLNNLINQQLVSNQHFVVDSQSIDGVGSIGELTSYAMPSSNLYMVSLNQTSLEKARTNINNLLEGK
ncbi:MAG: LCP family protein [Streptococcus sp.]|nr:LCP family protein [Streptococcus sp.]